MVMFYKEIGENIRKYRLLKHMSMQELGDAIHKSKATVFKYEKGQSAIDVEVLLQLAGVLQVSYEQLLPASAFQAELSEQTRQLLFSLDKSYFYQYGGPERGLIKGRFEALSQNAVTLYYDCADPTDYKKCRLIYWGHCCIEGNIVNLFLQNQKHNIEYCFCSAIIPIVNDDYIYGFINGLSSSTLSPIVNKFLVSKKPLAADENLLQFLTFSKEELNTVKKSNTMQLSLQHFSLDGFCRQKA